MKRSPIRSLVLACAALAVSAADAAEPAVEAAAQFGRIAYADMSANLFAALEENQTEAGLLAADRVFEAAGDRASFERLVRIADTNRFRVRSVRSAFEETAEKFGCAVWCGFVLRVPADAWERAPSGMGRFERELVDRLHGGAADDARNVLLRVVEVDPPWFARLAPSIGLSGGDVFATCVSNMASAVSSGEPESVVRTWRTRALAALGLKRKHDESVSAFLSLLDRSDPADLWCFVDVSRQTGRPDDAADALAAWIRAEPPVSDVERNRIQDCCSRLIPEDEMVELVRECRRTTLIASLLDAGRADEAQAWAESFYGPGARPDNHVTAPWTLLGRTQAGSGARFFKDRADSLSNGGETNRPSFLERHEYYLGRGEKETAERILRDGIRDCAASGERLPERLSLAFRLAGFLDANHRTAEADEVLRDAYEAGFAGLDGVEYGQKNETANAHARVFHALVCRLRERRRRAEWDRLFRREIIAGRPGYFHAYLSWSLECGCRLDPDDPVILSLLEQERKPTAYFAIWRPNRFPVWGHMLRLCFASDDQFEAGLDEAVEDSVRLCNRPFDGLLSIMRELGHHPPVPRAPSIAARLFDEFGEDVDIGECWRFWTAGASLRGYDLLKTELERAWSGRRLSAEQRREGLRILRGKAPDEAERIWCETELSKFFPAVNNP